MLKVVDLVYYYHQDYNRPQQVLEKHNASLGFVDFINDRLDISFVKHANLESVEKIKGIEYAFFRSRNKFWYIPFKTHRYIRKLRPDIVIVEGLIFPLQLILLKFQLGKSCKIFARHHNEKPFNGVKRVFQKMADKCTSMYLFTSSGDATEWVNKKVIKNLSKCREILEASTYFNKQDKAKCQATLGMTGSCNFIWVGRLNKNKDPFTILAGFEKYASINTNARLYMVYQENQEEANIKRMIEQSVVLKNVVILIGKVDHAALPGWYSAANFYISGTHRDASSYALLEAMACGCIPVVTAIPSFIKITCEGEYGILFEPGNVEELYKKLLKISSINQEKYSDDIYSYAKEHLSHKSIADQLYEIAQSIAK